jgi:hypothetical protein
LKKLNYQQKMKIKWKSIFPASCFKGEYPSPKPKKVVSTKPRSSSTSTHRISIEEMSYPNTTQEDLSISLVGSNLHVFTVAELKVITQHFSSSNFIGEGGFGPVHKGFIEDRVRPGLKAQPVAVKLLDLESKQGHKEWLVSIFFYHHRFRKSEMDFLLSYSFRPSNQNK